MTRFDNRNAGHRARLAELVAFVRDEMPSHVVIHEPFESESAFRAHDTMSHYHRRHFPDLSVQSLRHPICIQIEAKAKGGLLEASQFAFNYVAASVGSQIYYWLGDNLVRVQEIDVRQLYIVDPWVDRFPERAAVAELVTRFAAENFGIDAHHWPGNNNGSGTPYFSVAWDTDGPHWHDVLRNLFGCPR